MDTGELRIRRGSGFVDSLRAYEVLVDGQPVGEIRADEVRSFSLPPGDHDLQLRISWCASRVLAINISTDKPVCLRCDSSSLWLGLYRALLSHGNYIQLHRESERAPDRAGQPSTSR